MVLAEVEKLVVVSEGTAGGRTGGREGGRQGERDQMEEAGGN